MALQEIEIARLVDPQFLPTVWEHPHCQRLLAAAPSLDLSDDPNQESEVLGEFLGHLHTRYLDINRPPSPRRYQADSESESELSSMEDPVHSSGSGLHAAPPSSPPATRSSNLLATDQTEAQGSTDNPTVNVPPSATQVPDAAQELPERLSIPIAVPYKHILPLTDLGVVAAWNKVEDALGAAYLPHRYRDQDVEEVYPLQFNRKTFKACDSVPDLIKWFTSSKKGTSLSEAYKMIWEAKNNSDHLADLAQQFAALLYHEQKKRSDEGAKLTRMNSKLEGRIEELELKYERLTKLVSVTGISPNGSRKRPVPDEFDEGTPLPDVLPSSSSTSYRRGPTWATADSVQESGVEDGQPEDGGVEDAISHRLSTPPLSAPSSNKRLRTLQQDEVSGSGGIEEEVDEDKEEETEEGDRESMKKLKDKTLVVRDPSMCVILAHCRRLFITIRAQCLA